MNVTATLFAQMITFGVLVWFMRQFLWEPITQLMEARKTRIAEGLAASEQGRQAQALAEQQAKGLIQQARQQAAEIIIQAQKQANGLIDEAKQQARVEGDRQLGAAQTEIAQEYNRAREQLRGSVAALAVLGAERILEREIDPAAHRSLLDNLIAEL
jgi:F-type H+-transporting ATPase subunit b